MHALTTAILAASLTPLVTVAQVQCPRCKGPNGNSCHCQPGGALIFGQGSSSSGSSSSSSATLDDQIRATDDYISRQDALREQLRRDRESWSTTPTTSAPSSNWLNDFYANQRAQQNSLLGTYNDHVGGIITRDMFADDEAYVEEPMWTGGTYWPAEEYVTDAEARAIHDRLNQRDAYLQTIRAQNAQAEIDARHEQSRREAENRRQMEAEKRRLFFQRRNSQAAALKTLIRTDTAPAGPSRPSTLAALAAAPTAAASRPAVVASPQTQSALGYLATASAQQGADSTLQQLIATSYPSATDLARAAYDAVVPVKDEDAWDFGKVGEKMDEHLSSARSWLSSSVRSRPITSDNAMETSRVLGLDAALAHLRAVITRTSDDVEASADKKANIIDWVRQGMEQQSKPPQ